MNILSRVVNIHWIYYHLERVPFLLILSKKWFFFHENIEPKKQRIEIKKVAYRVYVYKVFSQFRRSHLNAAVKQMENIYPERSPSTHSFSNQFDFD